MAGLLAKLPIINLWEWADGDEYTVDDDMTTLTPELAESDEKTDKAYNERYKQSKKGNGGKAKKLELKEEVKVGKEQLNNGQAQVSKKRRRSSRQEER